MKIKLKPIDYIAQIIILLLISSLVLNNINYSEIDFMDALNIILSILIFSEFIRTILNPFYLKADRHQITIYKRFFRKKTIIINEVSAVEDDYNPFPKVALILKSGKKIKLNRIAIKDQDLEDLKKWMHDHTH